MSGEIEAAGAAATAGLAAAAIERGESGPPGEGLCLNCGAPLAGRFCAQCGQSAHVHRTLAHVFDEFLHGVVHFDTKAWRTLPMLAVRPGTLTHDYIHGKRARYISPLAMFLFTVFLMFFVFAITGPPNLARVEVRARDAPAAAATNSDWRAQLREGVLNGDVVVNLGDETLNEKVRDKLLNPDLALYKVQQTGYKLSFLLIPISLPFLALLFLFRRGVTLYDHVVFLLYSISFMSLLFMALSLLAKTGAWTESVIAPTLLVAPPVHMFFQLGGAYGLKWLSALWRTMLLMIGALISLLIFFLLILVLGLVG